jgi:prepilin-type processing-associated H-X9-DG protein
MNTLTFLPVLLLAIPPIVPQAHPADRARTAAAIRQVLMACIGHAQENKGAWPDDLASLRGLPPEAADLVYIKPIHPNKSADTQVAVHEAYRQPPQQLNVGFVDGHVELLFFDQFQKLLEASKARNQSK